MLARIDVEVRIGNLGNFAFGLGTNARTAGFLALEQTHLAKKVSRVEVSDYRFLAFLILKDDRNRTAHDVIQGFALVPFVNDGGFVGVFPAVSIAQEIFKIVYVRGNGG